LTSDIKIRTEQKQAQFGDLYLVSVYEVYKPTRAEKRDVVLK